MAIETIRCTVGGWTITRVTDFEGGVLQLICPQYDAPHHRCRLKDRVKEGGPLAQLLERTREHTLDSRSASTVTSPSPPLDMLETALTANF
jgi:hypothetical protein